MDLPYKILRMFLYGKIHYIIANPILVGMAMGYNPQESLIEHPAKYHGYTVN